MDKEAAGRALLQTATDGETPRVRTVVVDDSPSFVEVICDLAELQDLDIVGRAKNGPEAIEAVVELEPDLVLMDVYMPGMSGLTTAALLTQHFPETKIILMSDEDSRKLRADCRTCGAHGFINKTNLINELGTVLTGWRLPAGTAGTDARGSQA